MAKAVGSTVRTGRRGPEQEACVTALQSESPQPRLVIQGKPHPAGGCHRLLGAGLHDSPPSRTHSQVPSGPSVASAPSPDAPQGPLLAVPQLHLPKSQSLVSPAALGVTLSNAKGNLRSPAFRGHGDGQDSCSGHLPCPVSLPHLPPPPPVCSASLGSLASGALSSVAQGGTRGRLGEGRQERPAKMSPPAPASARWGRSDKACLLAGGPP